MHVIVSLGLLLSAAYATPVQVPTPGGHLRAGHDQRIVGGQNATEGEFPFVVSHGLMFSEYKHSCTASILTSNWVLTAAHCCADRIQGIIRAGSIYLDKVGSEHPVKELIRHPGYSSKRLPNDICLARVSVPFVFNKYIQQTTLPTKDFPVEIGDDVSVVGWGLTALYGLPSNRLQKGLNYKITKCEVGSGEGVCGVICPLSPDSSQSVWKGDSGGPLLKGTIQIGVASKAFYPGIHKPAVYTDIRAHIDWIKEELGDQASQLKFHKINY